MHFFTFLSIARRYSIHCLYKRYMLSKLNFNLINCQNLMTTSMFIISCPKISVPHSPITGRSKVNLQKTMKVTICIQKKYSSLRNILLAEVCDNQPLYANKLLSSITEYTKQHLAGLECWFYFFISRILYINTFSVSRRFRKFSDMKK